MDFERKDYIYLRILEDYKDENGTTLKKGQILRYRKEWLVENILGRQYGRIFNYENDLIFEKNADCDENDFLYNKVYKSATVPKDGKYKINIWAGDYFYLNDWLFEHMDENGINSILSYRRNLASESSNDTNLIEIDRSCQNDRTEATLYFKKGEAIDFSNPAVITLLYNMNLFKMFINAEIISGHEKDKLFNEDFSNAISDQNPRFAQIDKSEWNLCEIHYFRIKDNIKIKTRMELSELVGRAVYCAIDITFDEEGYIKYIYTHTGAFDSSSRDVEQEVLMIADRITIEEAKKCNEKIIAEELESEKIWLAETRKKMEEEKLELERLYASKKNDPSYFPGVNGYFLHHEKDEIIKKEKYTLLQIKEFYQRLNELNPDIVKEMCFYGGTIPYVLNDATKSRDFGDIDIFMPVPLMESLRTELAKQSSFTMIFDSKPLAQQWNLNSRIQKKSNELTNEKEQTNEFLGLMFKVMNTKSSDSTYLDENGNNYDPFLAFFNKNRPYYYKPQDFGFKANLFGINISVFPMYQYETDIMAKSFNINDMYKFLLGVRIINNTSINDFTRNITLYDATFKILPLEYTLVSKKSAVDERYSYRFEKDKKDVEYILAHKDELGIDDEKIQEILSKYPDYSVSVAYMTNEYGEVLTLSGETYKEFVLTKRNIS